MCKSRRDFGRFRRTADKTATPGDANTPPVGILIRRWFFCVFVQIRSPLAGSPRNLTPSPPNHAPTVRAFCSRQGCVCGALGLLYGGDKKNFAVLGRPGREIPGPMGPI